MINGFKTKAINIKRGVKQGDALSCALFILSIDPLIRNLRENRDIEGVIIKSKLSNDEVELKVSGYADDIAIICKSNNESTRAVFYEYERLTKISGLELNADKTEILNLNCNIQRPNFLHHFEYLGQNYTIKEVEKIKICGLVYSNCYNDIRV
jgi:hypothetical protein